MTGLFKGYVRTKEKKCVQKFKGDVPLLTKKEADKLDEFAGVLAKETLLIDIDNQEQAEILMDIVEEKNLDCKVVQTTRGKHFFFKNNGTFTKSQTGVRLACGLTADIKTGYTNSYAIVKFNGVERFCEWGDDDSVGVVPDWLQVVHTKTDFSDMEEGDGRDSALFSYILNLQSAGISKEGSITAINLINKHLLKDKLSDSDIERITRDDAFLKPTFFDGGKFLFDSFARYMQSEHNIIRIDSQLHLFKDGYYQAGLAEIESAMIKHIPDLNRARRKEVIDYLDILIRDDTPVTSQIWIAFKNGLLNLETDEFSPFTSDVIVTNVIPHNYNPTAYDELTDKTLDRISCNDSTVRKLLEELAGSCLYRSNKLVGGKAFILTGTGSNGKSTYLDMIKSMLGKRNTSVLDMKKLSDRFSTVMLYGKLANVGDDIGDGYIDDSSTFKKIVTGESIDAEQKGQPKFDFTPYSKMIFSANNIPRVGKGRDTTAIKRRLVIIPFNASFSPNDPDYVPFIGEKLKTETAMEYLINLAVVGLKRVLTTKSYSTNEDMDKALQDFEEANNPVLGFFNDVDISEIENQPTKDVYTLYAGYCVNNGLNPMGKNEFSKQVKNYFGMIISDKKINGIKYRIFMRGE